MRVTLCPFFRPYAPGATIDLAGLILITNSRPAVVSFAAVAFTVGVAGAVLAEAGRAAPGHDGPGHLVRGLADHFVAEHDRAAGLHAGGVSVGLDNPRRAREIGRRGRERLVGRVDLVRVKHLMDANRSPPMALWP